MRRSDAPSLAPTILGMQRDIGLPTTVLVDTAFASGPAVAALQTQGIEPLIAIGCTRPHRAYDLRPTPKPGAPPRIQEPWRLAMLTKLDARDTKDRYKFRKHTAESVFGIIESALGFTRFHLCGATKVASEWTLVALAHNCRRLHRLRLT